MDNLKIIVSSDFHGDFPEITNEFDLFVIGGDVCPAHDHYFGFQSEWFSNGFIEWVNSLPYKNGWSKVVMVWGNHDFVGERLKDKDVIALQHKTNGRLVILKNDSYDFQYPVIDDGDEIGEIKTLKIFGTSYCKIFGRWAFMVNNEKLEEKYSKCPDDVDIFVSHDSPTTNNLGMISEGYSEGIDAGNNILAKYIENRKPKYFFSGHIHSGNHKFENVNGTWMANVSLKNERYNPVYDVLEFEMNRITKEIAYAE